MTEVTTQNAELDAKAPEILASPNSKAPKSLQDVLKGLEEEEDDDDEGQASLDLEQIGQLQQAKMLYEGPSKCDCCINWIEEYPNDLKSATDLTAESQKHAVILRYKKSHHSFGRKPLELHSIDILNPYLKKFLARVFRQYPGVDAEVEDLSFTKPFRPFFYCWSILQEERQQTALNSPDDTTTVDLLIRVLQNELGKDRKSVADLTSHGNITFELLWAIYPPGTVVFGKVLEKDTCFLVNEVSERSGYVRVELSYLDYDGKTYGWRSSSVCLSEFRGTKKIGDLDIVPKEYHSQNQILIQELMARGQKAINLTAVGYHSYNGPANVSEKAYSAEFAKLFDSDEFRSLGKTVDSRIMIDAVRFHDKHQNGNLSFSLRRYPYGLQAMIPEQDDCHKPAGKRHRNSLFGDDYLYSLLEEEVRDSLSKKEDDESWKAEQAELTARADLLKQQRWTEEVFDLKPEVFCQPVVRGYALQIKLWGEFHVDLVTPVEWNTDAFEKLAIDQSRKRLIRALVLAQISPKPAVFDDMIAGKGRGLILLLAGPPGTGKTLTAESVADLLQLPLYTLDASELGTETSKLEEKLGEILHLTERWNAVLLINEADAFLEKRGDHPDAQPRNKRVAVFLRMLEYFKGVLILTTNRAVDFDEAFFSRIHLSLQYPELGFDARKKIWTSFLKQPADLPSFEERDFDELAMRQYNGREIKNIVSMAHRLAESEDLTFSLECVKDVMSVLDTDLLKSGRGMQQQ